MVSCPECGKQLNPNVKRALYQHRYSNPQCVDAQKHKNARTARRNMSDEQAVNAVSTSDIMDELRRSNEKNEKMLQEMREMKESQLRMEQTNSEMRDTMLSLKDNPTIVQVWPMLNPIQKLKEIDLTEERFHEVRAFEYPQYAPNLGDKGASEVYVTKARTLQRVQPTSVVDEDGNRFYVDGDVLKVDKRDLVGEEMLQLFAKHDSMAEDARDTLEQRDPRFSTFRQELKSKLADVHLHPSDLSSKARRL